MDYRTQAIDWLADVGYMVEELESLVDSTLAKMIENLYDGGIYQFIMDGGN